MAKRQIDVLVSLVGLIVLMPVLAATALTVLLSMGRPIFFRQIRPGKDNQLFSIYKFRTMRNGPGSDAERLTRVGQVIRAASLDELPQLVNVLKGEMSLIGPRPLPEIYLGRYSDYQARRHEVRPGITGLAQVRGRNSISWQERFEHDVHYVDNASLMMDFQIVVETVRVVLRRTGISADGQATMPEFFGTETDEPAKVA